jgi:hypothetical protein
MNRREFLQASGAMAALGVSANPVSNAEADPGKTLPPWQPGCLDIHHIHTGRGNSTLAIFPDGTSLLIDAGASGTLGPAMDLAQPSASLRPGQWIARYVQAQLASTPRPALDYALVTHLHGDHIGDVTAQSPLAKDASYKLTGISDVAEVIPISRLIDRGYPSYDYPAKVSDPAGSNYVQFVRSAAARGAVIEQASPGAADQIKLHNFPERYPGFAVRVLAANGSVWIGNGEAGRPLFPPAMTLGRNPTAMENSCSIALRISYGKFSYLTCGDLNCDTNYGSDPWRDVETVAGEAAGPVSVATCNHHGYFDANGPAFVRAVRPRVWVLQSWHASHPALSTLANLYSPVLYPGPRDVFCLGLHPAAALACGRFSDSFLSSQGHVVIRVMPGGEYSVLVIAAEDESRRIKAIFGPYSS